MLKEISERVAQNLGFDKYTVGFIIKPMAGYDMFTSKFILTLSNKKVKERFMVKIVNSPAFIHYLQNEARSILRLQNMRIQGIPSIITCGMNDYRYYIVERFISGSRAHASTLAFKEMFGQVKSWILNVQNRTTVGYFDPRLLLSKAVRYSENITEFFDLNDAVYYMERKLPDTTVPLCTVHGDMWHGNILVDSKNIHLVDFALSSEAEPPIDILDFIADYQPSILLNAQALATLCKSLLPPNVDPIFLTFYSLLRRLSIRVTIAKKLYDQLLVFNLSTTLNEMKEAGLIKYILMRI